MSKRRERLLLSTVNVKRIQKRLLKGGDLDYTTILFFLFDRLINRKVKCESFSTL